MLAEGKNPSGQPRPLAVDENDKLLVVGTFTSEPPVGGATEAKQDDTIDLLGGGLPAALTALGNLKVSIEEGGSGPGGGDASSANQLTQISQVGEVQASPTQYTVLDRLKALATLLSGGLPAALTSGGGVKTGLVDALPAGTNLIGKVGSDTSGTATLANVAASASNTTVLASNANRKRVVIVNDSTATLYVKFGATASATSYTYVLYGGDTYESPSNPIYTGQIDGIWASATGAARVTEMT